MFKIISKILAFKNRILLITNPLIFTINSAAIPPPLADSATLRPLPPNPCSAHPCGANSICQVVHNTAQCACMAGMIGISPSCRPECVVASDCPARRGCVNQKCVDPCPGTCGPNSDCRVIDHSPVCFCRPGFTGNAYAACRPLPVVGKIRPNRVFFLAEIDNATLPIFKNKRTTLKMYDLYLAVPAPMTCYRYFPVTRVVDRR